MILGPLTTLLSLRHRTGEFGAPAWLVNIAKVNPFSWAVDGVRALFAGDLDNDRVWQGLLITAVLAVLAVVWAARSFARSVR
jgi:ABC-2 type transport system permease protein